MGGGTQLRRVEQKELPTLVHYQTIDSPAPVIKRWRISQQVVHSPTICKVLTFDQIIVPTIPFFSAFD